jgi:Family of unknown function (DUF6494)
MRWRSNQPPEDGMNEEALNISVRKFLKKLGVTAQREIETAVRAAAASGRLQDSDRLPAKAVVTVGGIDLTFEIDGDIELA